ncbi:MAG: CHAT domain-containing protein [Verrucomicrobiota bacterium]|jgi:hypothetical protein
MSGTSKNLKISATKLSLQKGGKHELLRKLIVDGFFDTPKTTNEIITEIRQNVGKRLKSNVIQTYMKRFMEEGIIYSFEIKQHHGNFWVLASVDKARATERALQLLNAKLGNASPLLSKDVSRESSSMPVRPINNITKTRILFLAANPIGTKQLSLDGECREIEQKLRASEHRDGFEFLTKWAVRAGDLLQYLNQHRPHVIHFSGHGSQTEELILMDSDDQPKPVSKAALKQLFTTLKDNIRVVVLNACFSRPQAAAITEVIDCAIGMNSAIGDKAAIVFAAAFYQALGFERSVKDAFESGKAALMLEGIPEEKIPELLVRKGVNPRTIFLIEPTGLHVN